MAYLIKLDIGYPQPLTQNVIYAMPAKRTTVHSSGALDVANDVAFTTNGTIAANTPTVCAAAFVRCTAITNAIITIKAD